MSRSFGSGQPCFFGSSLATPGTSGTRVDLVEEAVLVGVGLGAAVLLRVLAGDAGHLGARVDLVEEAVLVPVFLLGAAVLLRVGAGDALHGRASVDRVEDPVAVGVDVARHLRRVLEREQGAHVRRADAGREAWPDAGADLQELHEAILEAGLGLGVRVAHVGLVEAHAARRLDADLEAAIFQQQAAEPGAPQELVAGGRVTDDRGAAELGTRGERPDEAVGPTAHDRVRIAADRAVGHVRVLAADGDPDVPAERDLERVVVLAEEPHPGADAQIADRRSVGRRQLDVSLLDRALAALEERKRHVEVHRDAVEQHRGRVQMHDELVLDHAALALATRQRRVVRAREDERVVAVVDQQAAVHVEDAVARRVRRGHAEEAISSEARAEHRQLDLLLRARDGGRQQRRAQHPEGSEAKDRTAT
ncbi:MAG: hypothetical protein IPG04_00690 [Polyangiaceae bacterium]|nr:hypothetical protein [Polyangiaceae bacterium]